MATMKEMHVTVDGKRYHFVVDEKTGKMMTEDHNYLLACINKLRCENEKSSSTEQSSSERSETNVQSVQLSETEKIANEWTRQATVLLINTRIEMEEEFLKPIQKSKLWQRISDSLKKNGYTFHATECHSKWRNLMCTYRKNVDRTKESGGGTTKCGSP
ncbi:trihelix transcription factor GTL1-like [Centruroides sculpturatus]|uniref:trihelix transcription factor GTL1-like n=1 Tax=Centruroides sculpturatus TaxID=218467 RepID=UPI000C6DA668|nr:trihelix transcription factor GTL1-like [Centruroides sculpturatus]